MATNYSYLINETVEDRSWLKDIALVLGSSILISLFSPISIPLPFTPVPIATQMNVILLLSCFLGSKRALLAVLIYLFQGAIGFPVFSNGASGIIHLAGPRGGYLLGYAVAAFVTGFLMERTCNRTSAKAFAAMGIGNLIVYLFGFSWLSHFIGWGPAFVLGIFPFVIGDVVKLFIATASLKSLRFFRSKA